MQGWGGLLCFLFWSHIRTQKEAQGSVLKVLRSGGEAGAREVAQDGITSVSQVYCVSEDDLPFNLAWYRG